MKQPAISEGREEQYKAGIQEHIIPGPQKATKMYIIERTQSAAYNV